jgi:hypothetical protein
MKNRRNGMTDVKGTETIGAPKFEDKEVEIIGGGSMKKGVRILDKNSKTDQPSIETTVGEGDRDD